MSDGGFVPLVFGTMPGLTIYDDGSSDFRIPATPELLALIGDAVNDPTVTVCLLIGSVPKAAS